METAREVSRAIRHKYTVRKGGAEKREIQRKWILTAASALWLATAPIWFHLADLERGYDATGGELLLMALPFIVYGFWAAHRDGLE